MAYRKLKAVCTYSLLILIFLANQPVSAKDFDDSEFGHVAYPAWFKTNFYDLNADLSDAADNNKMGVMLLFTTEGCSYCAEFIRTSLADKGLADLVKSHFDSIGLEIFDDNEMTVPGGTSKPLKDYANDVGAAFAPTLVFLDTDGRVMLKRVGYLTPENFKTVLDYLINREYQNRPYSEYIRDLSGVREGTQSVSPLRPNPMFEEPPYMLDRGRFSATKPLLALFESKNCPDCAKYHDSVLGNEDVKKLLSNFEIVRFDIDDDTTPVISPAGKPTTPANWYKDEKISYVPAMLFFDEQGREVLRIDAVAHRNRVTNALNFVLDKAYLKGWTYQRYARTKSIEKLQSHR